MKEFFKNKKFKYGSLGIGFTAAVIALLVVLNLIVYTVVYSKGWFFDMTGEKVYNLSENVKEYIDKIDPEYNNITIYFFADEDKMNMAASSTNYSADTSMWGMKYVHSLAKELDERYSFIKCEYLDLEREPDKIKEIVGEEYYAAAKLKSYHVIIDNYTVERESDGKIINGTDGKPLYWHNYRIYSRNSFYSFDYQTSGQQYFTESFKGDYRFCSAIKSVCEEKIPTAYFISGHGENVGAYTVGVQDSSYNQAQYIWQVLRDSGYNIKKIDLQHESFGNEENALAVIYSPSTDYSGSAESGEGDIGKLSAFLEKDGHSLMAFLDYEAHSLPNLEKYIESALGVKFEDAQVKDNGDNSIDVAMTHVVGSLNSTDGSFAKNVTSQLKESTKKMIFPISRPISITDTSKAEPLVYAPKSSSGYYPDKTVSYAENSACLATLTKLRENSYALCVGSSYATDVTFTDSPKYDNRDLFLAVFEGMSGAEYSVGIEYKIIASEGLDITKGEATRTMILISAVIPAAVALIGFVVYIRRRHS